MTKKANELLSKYNEKLDVQVWLYREGFQDFTQTQDRICEEQKEFESLLSTMFHYNLLSEKDFTELSLLPFHRRREVMDVVLGI